MNNLFSFTNSQSNQEVTSNSNRSADLFGVSTMTMTNIEPFGHDLTNNLSSTSANLTNPSGSSHLTKSDLFNPTENCVHNLWFDLIWAANQAMSSLVCAGPIQDAHSWSTDFGVKPTPCAYSESNNHLTSSSNLANVCLMRWISGLLVARDISLSSSPWLWHSPIVCSGLVCNSLILGGASLCGNCQTRSRSILIGGGHRLDSVN